MLLFSNSIWKQHNTHYTLTLINIKAKIFPRVGEENESKKGLIFFLFMWKGGGGRATLRPLARMATEY